MMRLLFTISLFELFIGGGGRLLEVGPGTIRMVLFGLCLLTSLVYCARHPIQSGGVRLAIILVFIYVLVYMIPILMSVVKGYGIGDIMVEVQQSLYWLAAPFFAAMLRSPSMPTRIALIVRIAGMVLAISYIGVVSGLIFGVVDYSALYVSLSKTGEFIFRTDTFFFYKGFIYLGVAAIFFIALRERYSVVGLFFVSVALAMTLTRGFILATSVAAMLLLLAQKRGKHFLVSVFIASCVVFATFVYVPSQDETLLAARSMSNSVRLEDFNFMLNNIGYGSLIFGEGFGSLINDRPTIENTFLWAWWRLGVFGVLFWLLPLVLCFYYFIRVDRFGPYYRLATAYAFSVLLIYIQTNTNPYLNNPIGLSFILVSIFSLRTLSKIKPEFDAGQPAPGVFPTNKVLFL